ncbi:MAG TPA: S53 family peptidase [Candidatus Bathyarchaeia archaeon]|nr:S53 family peptidase [Candidatus Bathyarchaeia archaeon]
MKIRLYLSLLIAVIMPFTSLSTANAARLPFGNPHRQVCSQQPAGVAKCSAHVVYDGNGSKPLATTAFTNGYAPADLTSAYNLPAAPKGNFVSNGQTVAIVDAYDNPNVASDVLAYRKQFNLPLCATTKAAPTVTDLTGCFLTKVNQSGATTGLSAANVGWGQEIDLDVEMVSAACPSCKILLVEASSNSYGNLGTAVNRAVAMGANAVSNSYGGGEFSSETLSTYAAYYNHPGVAITASSGDAGYGTEFPAVSPYVTAVGGTSLKRDTSSRGWNESVWSGAGSGCSSYVAALSWQSRVGTCTHRLVADVAAIADPNTGVAVYDSYGSSNGANWYVFGGTSVAAPIIASVYALAGNAGGAKSAFNYGEYPYAHKASLNDVTSGSNGSCTTRFNMTNLALCTAGTGYDGPTGLGSPNGIGAF